MTRIFAIGTLVTLLVGTVAGQRNQTKTKSDEEAIRKILLERVESFNRHEAPRANTFTADADFVNVYGLWRKGAAEIEARQGERMQTVLKDAMMTLIELRVRFIKPDVAIVHQRHEIGGMRDAAGKTMPTVQELSIRVMVKQKAKWLTTAFHNTIVRPVEPSPKAASSPTASPSNPAAK